MIKILIFFKTTCLDNNIYKITKKYMNIHPNVESYFLICDENINTDIIVDYNNKTIKIKMNETNWDSLLIKVIKGFSIFKDSSYSHVLVSNISTFLNIKKIYKKLSEENSLKSCYSHIGNYTFKNINYNFPSGACYIFNKELVDKLTIFFEENNYIENNKLSNEFINKYPTTDDIFFGYYLYLNKIEIESLDRFDLLNPNNNIDINSLNNHLTFRIKTNNQLVDEDYFVKLYENYMKN